MQSKTPASNVSFCFFYTSCNTQYIIFKFYYDFKVISKGIIIFANMKMSGSIWVQSLKHYGRCGYFEVLIYCESRLKYFVAKRQEMKCFLQRLPILNIHVLKLTYTSKPKGSSNQATYFMSSFIISLKSLIVST